MIIGISAVLRGIGMQSNLYAIAVENWNVCRALITMDLWLIEVEGEIYVLLRKIICFARKI